MSAVGLRAAPARRLGDLLVELLWRDLRLRYRRSVLGVLWAQVAPLATAAVLTVIFTRVVPLGIEDYAVVLLAGLLPWTWFQSSLVGGTGSVVEGRDLLRQPGFPTWLLPITAVTGGLVQYLLALPVLLVAVVAFTGRVPATATLLPLLLAVQFLLLLGPVLALATLHVRYRDTAQVVAVALIPLFYATPVFYDAGRAGQVPLLETLNPLVPLLAAYRDVLLEGQVPPAAGLLRVAVLGTLGAVAGAAVFSSRRRRFVEDL